MNFGKDRPTIFDAARPVAIEDHAFRNCVKLENASMANVSSLGVRPFAGCEKLADINFQNSEKIGRAHV